MIVFEEPGVTLHHGDCIEVMRELPDASVDSVVTDPPYGLEFMGKDWDNFGGDSRQPFRGEVQTPDNPYGRSTVRFAGSSSYGARLGAMQSFELWCAEWAAECLRVLKPGGHLLAFGGTRTAHRLTAGIEDAGFEIRDSISWLYGSGFPKSLDVSKAIDTSAGATREVTRFERVGIASGSNNAIGGEKYVVGLGDDPATDAAKAWQGWGTALKPAHEPIVVARKPLQGTVANNVQTWGTGALNIDATRVDSDSDYHELRVTQGGRDGGGFDVGSSDGTRRSTFTPGSGRWPSNVVLDETQAQALDEQTRYSESPTSTGRGASTKATSMAGPLGGQGRVSAPGDSGGASRFFPTFRYEPKAGTAERPGVDGVQHPTVKPLDLMRWLCRLVTPKGGTILEPFAGSGTTLEAALLEGFQVIGIEREADYLPLIMQRITKPLQVAMFGDWEES